jgi:hypothetical protein
LDLADAGQRFACINRDLAANDEASVAFGLVELGPDESLTDLITRADRVMYANRHQRSRDREPSAHDAGRVSTAVE